jgi:hypothetical protein
LFFIAISAAFEEHQSIYITLEEISAPPKNKKKIELIYAYTVCTKSFGIALLVASNFQVLLQNKFG